MIESAQRNSSRGARPATPKVAVIVLSWNGKSLTLDCLESLTALEYGNVDIIVVDNGSTDGTEEAIRAAYGNRIEVLVNDENLGYSEGNNVGVHCALERGAAYILLLNNDTTVDPKLLDGLTAAFARFPDAGIVGPKIFYPAPSKRIWFAGGEVHLSRGTVRHTGIREVDTGQYDTIREVDYVSGCALMARREVFETIGLLDSSFEAYFEDTDFCMRARKQGFRILYVPAGKVWHKISASTGGQLGRQKISRRLRSGFRFFRRYASPHHWLTIPFFFGVDVIRIVILVAFGRIRDTGDMEKVIPGKGN